MINILLIYCVVSFISFAFFVIVSFFDAKAKAEAEAEEEEIEAEAEEDFFYGEKILLKILKKINPNLADLLSESDEYY